MSVWSSITCTCTCIMIAITLMSFQYQRTNDQSASSSCKRQSRISVPPAKRNPWNEFQKENKGKGWSPKKMSEEYWKSKSGHATPGHLKKDGNPDMRYKANRKKLPQASKHVTCTLFSYSDDSDHERIGSFSSGCDNAPRCRDGSLDMRYACNRGKSKAAESAIRAKKDELIETLSISEAVFRYLVSACESKAVITGTEARDLLDTMNRQTLQARAVQLTAMVQLLVKYCPDQLDVFLSILQEKGNRPIQEIARHIKCLFEERR